MGKILRKALLAGMFALNLWLLFFNLRKLARLGWAILFLPPKIEYSEWNWLRYTLGLFFGLLIMNLVFTWPRRDKASQRRLRRWALAVWMVAIAMLICATGLLIEDTTVSADDALALMGIDEADLVALPTCEKVRWLVRLSPYVKMYAGKPFFGGRVLSPEGPVFGPESTYDLVECVVQEGVVLVVQADRGRRDERAWWAAQVLAEFLTGLYWRYDYLTWTGDYSRLEAKPDLSYPEAQYFLHQMVCPPAYPNYGMLVDMYYRARFGVELPLDWDYEQVMQELCAEEKP